MPWMSLVDSYLYTNLQFRDLLGGQAQGQHKAQGHCDDHGAPSHDAGVDVRTLKSQRGSAGSRYVCRNSVYHC